MISRVLAVLGLLSLQAPAAAQELLPTDWHASIRSIVDANRWYGIEADDPLLATMQLCHAPGCPSTATLSLAADQANMIRARFLPLAETAEQERRAIAETIAHLERVTADALGTWDDKPANTHSEHESEGQLDCVAETINTLTYLDRLALAGLIVHHDIGHEVIRFTLILQHIAVEMIEVDSGDSWIVDSWPAANGDEPTIQPYLQWRNEWQV